MSIEPSAHRAVSQLVLSFVALSLSLGVAHAQSAGNGAPPAPPPPTPAAATPEAPPIASDNDRMDGDHLTLNNTVWGFVEVGRGDDLRRRCAPAQAKFVVVREINGSLTVRFLKFDPALAGLCPADQIVATHTLYRIQRTELAVHDFKRTGFAFGALVVPFKFRLGDNELVTSSTIAPYVGWRMGFLQSTGLTFTPVLSAGLALVPVADPQTSKTETKSALSLSAGLVLGSSKNDQFQAGVLFGKDFANQSDRDKDPGVKKPWVSVYIGYNMSSH